MITMTPHSSHSNNVLFGGVQRAAAISEDGRYRWTLERWWDEGDGAVLFAMLNPSTADSDVDDPTIRRCMDFAQRWGKQGLIVWNLYGYRATDPAELDHIDDPVGRENEDHLWRAFDDVDLIVAAWGARPGRGRHRYRDREQVMKVGPFFDCDLHVLELTKDGHPRHPLYVKAEVGPVLWLPAGSDRSVIA